MIALALGLGLTFPSGAAPAGSGPAPSNLVRVLAVLNPMPVSFAPGATLYKVDNGDAIVTAQGISADDEFADLDAMDAAWLGSETEDSVAVADLPDEFEAAHGGSVLYWSAPGVALSTGFPLAASSSLAVDTLASAIEQTRADVLTLLDANYRPAFPEFSEVEGYLVVIPYQNVKSQGYDLAGLNAAGDPPSDLGVPALLIAYTGT